MLQNILGKVLFIFMLCALNLPNFSHKQLGFLRKHKLINSGGLKVLSQQIDLSMFAQSTYI